MATPKNPFIKIRQDHQKCAPEFLARIAFGSGTYRIFTKGSGERIRAFVKDTIGDGQWLIRGDRRDFEANHEWLVRAFPSNIRLAKGKHKNPNFGHKAKIIDLYMKFLCALREPLAASATKRLRRRIHVPLDNIVLKWVWKDFRKELQKMKLGRKDLYLSGLNKSRYSAIQKLLADKAKKARTIPIMYDDNWARSDR